MHPPHRCGISKCWLESVIIAQVCLRLATIKGHSKMCSFTVLGGPGGGPKTSQYLVWPPFASQSTTSPSHRVDQVVDCGLWNVGSLLFNGCAKLLDIGRNWNTLSYTPIQSIQNMLNGWQCPVSMLAMQELGCFQLPGIVYRSLQHGAVHYHAATWGDGRGWMAQQWPQDLVTVSLCIQNAINKMHLCSLSITYACPYHNPTATMGHSIHNVDISKPLTHTTPYTLPAICPVQRKPGFIHEENTSPKCQMPSNVSICPLKSVTTTNCSQVETLMRTTSMQMSFPEKVSDSCAEILWLCKPIVAAAVRVAGLRRSWRWRCWMWRSWAGVVTHGLRLWGRLDVLPNSLKRLWRRLMVEKLTFNSRATALVDIPAVSMPIARSLKTCDICGIVLCDKTAHFRVSFYCGQPKAHLCNNHAV